MTTCDYRNAASELRALRMELAWPVWLIQRMIDREGDGGSVTLPPCLVILDDAIRVPQTFTLNAPSSEFRIEYRGCSISLCGVTFMSVPRHPTA